MVERVYVGSGYRLHLVAVTLLAVVLIVGIGRVSIGLPVSVLLGIVVVTFTVLSIRHTGAEFRRLDDGRVLVRLRIGLIVVWRRVSSAELLLVELDQRRKFSWLMRSKWPGLYSFVLTGVDGQTTWRKRLTPEYLDNMREVDARKWLVRARALVGSVVYSLNAPPH